MKLKTIAVAFASILTLTTQAIAQQAFYMANEAVMVTDGDTKVLFDPLYAESYGQYLLVPEAMRAALFAGNEPFDGVDAILLVTSTEITSPLTTCSAYWLRSPTSFSTHRSKRFSLCGQSGPRTRVWFDRVNGVALEYLDPPVTLPWTS